MVFSSSVILALVLAGALVGGVVYVQLHAARCMGRRQRLPRDDGIKGVVLGKVSSKGVAYSVDEEDVSERTRMVCYEHPDALESLGFV